MAASESVTPVELLASGMHSRLILCACSEGVPVLLKATRLMDPQTAQRAAREIAHTAREELGPFVVHSRGWFATPGELFLTLDYNPGGDVELLIDREGSLNAGAARFYAGCLALALEALHEHNIVHVR